MGNELNAGESFIFSAGVTMLMHVAAYLTLKKKRSEKQLLNEREKVAQLTAFGFYETKIGILAQFVKDNYIFLQRNLNREIRNNGLIILDAYFGLDEHIYKIDAGVLLFRIP